MNSINQKGFSLIELVLVVTIIGIIAAIAVPSLSKAIAAAENGSAVSALKIMALAQSNLVVQKGRFGTLDEVNSIQNGTLGTITPPNTLVRGKFKYEMIPANPTPAELKTAYRIKATRVIDAAQTPYVVEMDEKGFITAIFQ